MISRATKGKVTNRVARIMPGTAKMIWMPCASSQPPNAVCAPNNKTNIKPATTGDTENGKSSSVVSNCLPRKSKRVKSHAIATPKTALTGTTIAAVIRVNLIADKASVSESEARYSRQPPFKASANTAVSGMTSITARNSSAMPISSHCSGRGSVIFGLVFMLSLRRVCPKPIGRY